MSTNTLQATEQLQVGDRLPDGSIVGVNGNILVPFQPGQSGNPKGRPAAGAVISEWYNALVESDEANLRTILADKAAPIAKRRAALAHLRQIEVADLADLEGVIDGTETLDAARKRGLDTSVVKRVKRSRRTDDKGIETVTTEVELHPDRAQSASEHVFDRTIGRPKASIEHSGNLDIAAKRITFEEPPPAPPLGQIVTVSDAHTQPVPPIAATPSSVTKVSLPSEATREATRAAVIARVAARTTPHI